MKFPTLVTRSRSLQWGRGGFTAEIDHITVPTIALGELQWGRGGFTAEMQTHHEVLWPFGRASMGPRWIHRGDGESYAVESIQGQASMGPRWIHRGDNEEKGQCSIRFPASMGPRWIHRGDLRWCGNWCRRSRASMGPRWIHRGDMAYKRTFGDGSMLQWGRGGFTAEMTRQPVQPNFCICFNGAAVDSPRRCLSALPYAGAWAASMGPRWIHRGDSYSAPRMTRWKLSLQWGRGGFTAEMSKSCRLPCRSARLQWGRGGFTAEISVICASIGPFSPLQWGRGGFTAEMTEWKRRNTDGRHASMGPRWIHRGDGWRVDNGKHKGIASMGPRWIHRGDNRLLAGPWRFRGASMGPRWIHRGDTGFTGDNVTVAWLQWGRGGFTAEITPGVCL